jgi:hypothetical protein
MVARQDSTLHHSTPWWLWPNILSLDAPLVTFAWQWWFAKTFAVRLNIFQYLVLFLVVWLLYALDRWLDAWKLDTTKAHSSRHAFYLQHRWSIAKLWLVIFLVVAILAFTGLPRADIFNGLLLLVLCGVYFALTHTKPGRQFIPKEIQVGAVVSLGTTLCLWSHITLHLALATIAFALLITLNCVLIAFWEHSLDIAQGFTSVAARLPHPWLTVFEISFMGLSLSLSFWQTFYTPVWLSASLLLALPYLIRKTALRRVLADAVLLTPLLWLLVMGF